VIDHASATVRGRLVGLRDDALRQLAAADHLDGGMLALVGNVSSAIAAIDAAETVLTASLAERVVATDDGREIAVVTYSGADALARACLDPLAALHLGSQLVDAARRHLTRTASASVCNTTAPVSKRGGDPHSDRRRERDAALCEAAESLAPGEPAEVQARIVIDRLSRYRTKLGEFDPERLTLARIKATELHKLGVDRAAKIIRAGKQKTGLGTDGSGIV